MIVLCCATEMCKQECGSYPFLISKSIHRLGVNIFLPLM